MKLNTQVWLGWRHVGDSATDVIIQQMSIAAAMAAIIERIKDISLRKRIQISIATNEEECRKGLADAPRIPSGKSADGWDMLQSLITSEDKEESTNETR